MDYASGGELYDYLNRMKRINETEARAIFRQIVSAVHFLHKVRTSKIDSSLEVSSSLFSEQHRPSRFEVREHSHRSKRRHQSKKENIFLQSSRDLSLKTFLDRMLTDFPLFPQRKSTKPFDTFLDFSSTKFHQEICSRNFEPFSSQVFS